MDEQFNNFSEAVVQKFVILNLFLGEKEISYKTFMDVFLCKHQWIYDINLIRKVYKEGCLGQYEVSKGIKVPQQSPRYPVGFHTDEDSLPLD